MTTDSTHDSINNGIKENDETLKVVIRHKILSIQECFVYRIPPMKSSGGHRAEDWNLANPLATCALDMVQNDDILLIQLLGNRPMKNGPKGATEQFLFAQSKIQMNESIKKKQSFPMEHWAKPVVDSSRYFVLRILNEKTNREAFIGLGFRERNDAVNFRMGMQDYERSMKREELWKQQQTLEKTCDKNDDDTNVAAVTSSISSFSLKDGEKIHIPIKSSRRRKEKSAGESTGKGGLFLLKKPPPPADTNAIKNIHDTKSNTSPNDDHDSQLNVTEKPNDDDDDNDEDDDEDEDEWGDFQ